MFSSIKIKPPLKSRLKSNPEQRYLPKFPGYEYIDIPHVTWLNPEALPQGLSQKFPEIQPVNNFYSSNYQAFTMPFKNIGTNPPLTYLKFDKNLILNKALYEKYREQPAIINLIINPDVGYGQKPKEIGKLKPDKNHNPQKETITITNIKKNPDNCKIQLLTETRIPIPLTKTWVKNSWRKEIIINYDKNKPPLLLPLPKKEMCISLPVFDCNKKSLGDIKIYKQPHGVGAVIQNGLYIGSLDDLPWSQFIHVAFKEILGNSLVIELPRDVKLNISPDGLDQEHKKLIQNCIFAALMQAVIHEFVQKNINCIPTLPKDYYQDDFYRAIEPHFQKDAEKINQAIEKSSGWDFDINYDFYFKGKKARLNLFKLLTLISYEGSSLNKAITKPFKNPSLQFKRLISTINNKTKEHGCSKVKKQIFSNQDDKITNDPSQSNLDCRIIREIIKWLNENTKIRLHDVVFFKSDNATLATAGGAILNETTGEISWKMRFQYSNALKSWHKDLQQLDGQKLIDNKTRCSLFRVIAHEYAHILEYEERLEECLQKVPQIIKDPNKVKEYQMLIKKHFVSLFKNDNGCFGPNLKSIMIGLKIILKLLTLPLSIFNKHRLKIIKLLTYDYHISYNWTHNTDEKLATSFQNKMGDTLNLMAASRTFNNFKDFCLDIKKNPKKISSEPVKILEEFEGKTNVYLPYIIGGLSLAIIGLLILAVGLLGLFFVSVYFSQLIIPALIIAAPIFILGLGIGAIGLGISIIGVLANENLIFSSNKFSNKFNSLIQEKYISIPRLQNPIISDTAKDFDPIAELPHCSIS